jgi:uncharacterized protein YkwD
VCVSATHLRGARPTAAAVVLALGLIVAPSAAAGTTGLGALVHLARAQHAPRHATHRAKHRHPAHKAAGCTNTGEAAAPGDLTAMRASVLCLVNQQRTSRGLPALSEDSRLDRSAEGWTQAMVNSDGFTHGSDFAARISDAGFDWSYAGENIATGFPTPAAVVRGWMASLGHCRNILDPGFSRIGIGEVPHAVRGFASGPATWTQDFALPMGAHAPSGNTGPQNGCPY